MNHNCRPEGANRYELLTHSEENNHELIPEDPKKHNFYDRSKKRMKKLCWRGL